MTKDKVLIFDTTLRDGEQSPGATTTHDEKLEIAELLDEMGGDIIEAGFPIASEGDFKAVSDIATQAKSATICGLARANYKDIDRCWEAVKHAKSPRIHTFIGTSPLHRAIPNLNQDEMAERIHDTVTHARNLCENVQWSPMDATRTEEDYLCRVVEIAIKAGATTINIPDTVGYTAPVESADLIRMLIEKVPGADEVIFATHCHNDLGMATANSLAAVEGGARQIECTINGLGERAGNTALEEVVMALKVRGDIMPFETGIDTRKIMNISRRVATVSGFAVQFNKAIVGKNAFAHESGIHQDGMLKNRETFEVMKPEDVGLSGTSLPLGKHSGRAALRAKLTELGFDLADNQLNDVFVRFKDLADRKKEVFDDDLMALVYQNDSGDDRFGALTFHKASKAVFTKQDGIARTSGKGFQIHPRTEQSPCTGQNSNADIRVIFDPVKGGTYSVADSWIDRIALIRTVQGDRRDTSFGTIKNNIITHRGRPFQHGRAGLHG